MNFDQLIAAIIRGFGRLFDIAGREGRADFWPYALCIWFGGGAVVMIVAIPVMFSNMFDMIGKMERMARDNPQDWMVQHSAGGVRISYIGEDPAVIARLMPDATLFFAIVTGFGIVMIALLLAATIRRLHDRNRSGWWLVIPGALQAAGLVLMMRIFPQLMAGMGDSAVPPAVLTGFWLLFATNMAGLASLLLLLIQLVLPGDPGTNRYGPPSRPGMWQDD